MTVGDETTGNLRPKCSDDDLRRDRATCMLERDDLMASKNETCGDTADDETQRFCDEGLFELTWEQQMKKDPVKDETIL